MSSPRRPAMSARGRGRGRGKSKPSSTTPASIPDIFAPSTKLDSPEAVALRQWLSTCSVRRVVLDRPHWWRTPPHARDVTLDAVRSMLRTVAESLVHRLRGIAPRATGALRLRHVYPVLPPALLWLLDPSRATSKTAPTSTKVWLSLPGESPPSELEAYTLETVLENANRYMVLVWLALLVRIHKEATNPAAKQSALGGDVVLDAVAEDAMKLVHTSLDSAVHSEDILRDLTVDAPQPPIRLLSTVVHHLQLHRSRLAEDIVDIDQFVNQELTRLRPSDGDDAVVPAGAYDAFQWDAAIPSDVLVRTSTQIEQLASSASGAAAPKETVGPLTLRRLVDPHNEASIAIDVAGTAVVTLRQLLHPQDCASTSSSLDVASRMESIMVCDPAAVKRDDRITMFECRGFPADVSVDASGSTRWMSYINGLHPRWHAGMYSTLETMLAGALPLLECFARPVELTPSLETKKGTWEEPAVPIVPTQSPHYGSLRGRQIQVAADALVVDIAPVSQQSPPKLDDMMWRGSYAAHSKATAVVVVAADNVSGLRFALQRPEKWKANYRTQCSEARGFLSIIPGRCFVFPSLLEYRIELPLSGSGLTDPTKPGRVKLVMFHLVDPDRRVRSSAVLPPLQPKWILDAFLGPVARAFSLPWAVQALIGEILNIGVSADDAPTPTTPSSETESNQHQAMMKLRDRRAVIHNPPYRRTVVEKELLLAVDAARLERPRDNCEWVRSTIQSVLNLVCSQAVRHIKPEILLDVQPCEPGVDIVTRKLAKLSIKTENQDPYWLVAQLCVWDEILSTGESLDVPDKDALERKMNGVFENVCTRAFDRMVARLLSLLDVHDREREQVATLLSSSDFQLEDSMVDAYLTILRHVKSMERWLQRQWSVESTDLELSESAVSDSSVSADLRTEYLDHVARLRSSEENSSVNFLIDPSLYPLLPLMTVPRLTSSLVAHGWWGPRERLQNLLVADHVRVLDAPPRWVPADILVGLDGSVRILSYIRNLHPEHFGRLYVSMERLLERFVPLFDRVLTRLARPLPLTEMLIEAYGGVIDSWRTAMNRLAAQEDEEAPYLPVSLCGRTIQIVVEVVEVTVGADPTASAASTNEWRRLGPANTSILATGMYFAVAENLKTPRVSFRRKARSVASGVEECFFDEREPAHSEASRIYVVPESCGELPIVQDRCAVVPNYLEMRVDPLTREDESAPGRLHVLFFHLVSPASVFVESSTSASPLRADWVREATTSALTRAKRLPDRVQHVIEEIIGPMGMAADDVAKYRERLRGVHLFG
ncbi:hypothetical protein PINS_up010118 [Pythium insidiosum]|nr:hypothetical protein PINS_up010118 [Pythium insidiosum]